MPVVTVDETRCKGCELCISVCPKRIIYLSENKINEKGFRVAEVVKKEECIGCAFCAVICPDAAISIMG